MECDACGNNISMWSTPYNVNGNTLCKNCHADAELVAKLNKQPSAKGRDGANQREAQLARERAERRAAKEVLLTTTPDAPGSEVGEVFGLVFGEAVIGANVFSDALAGVRDVVGGRSGSYQNRLREAREYAVEDMAIKAHRKGANGVLGVRVDYEMVRDSMMMVTALGTAVRLEKKRAPQGHSEPE